MDHSTMRGGVLALVAGLMLSLGAFASPQQNPPQDSEQQGASQAQGHVHRSESLKKIQGVLDNWNSKSLDDLLADNVHLTLKVADMARDESGNLSMVSVYREVDGKDAVKKSLSDLNKHLHTETTITSELISGDEAVLLGDVTVSRTGSGKHHHDGKSPSGEPGQKGDQSGQEKKSGQESQPGGLHGASSQPVPVAIHLHFNGADKVDRMVIATMNLRTMHEGGGSKEMEQR